MVTGLERNCLGTLKARWQVDCIFIPFSSQKWLQASSSSAVQSADSSVSSTYPSQCRTFYGRNNESISRIYRAADPIKPIWHSISQVKLSPTRGSYDSSSSIDLPKSSSDQRIRGAESAHAYQYPEWGSYCTIYKQSEAQQGRRARSKLLWFWRISVVQAN